jgi:hypothetical protein
MLLQYSCAIDVFATAAPSSVNDPRRGGLQPTMMYPFRDPNHHLPPPLQQQQHQHHRPTGSHTTTNLVLNNSNQPWQTGSVPIGPAARAEPWKRTLSASSPHRLHPSPSPHHLYPLQSNFSFAGRQRQRPRALRTMPFQRSRRIITIGLLMRSTLIV